MNSRRELRSPETVEGGGGDEELLTISKAELEALREERGREMEEERRRVRDREEALRDAVRDRELAMALAGRELVPGAAVQLVKLWREELDVVEEEGRYRVVTRDGRGVMEAVTEWLSSREYAHFCPPTSRGGRGNPGQPKAGMLRAMESRTLGEIVLQRWKEAAEARGVGGGEPVGLGRRR